MDILPSANLILVELQNNANLYPATAVPQSSSDILCATQSVKYFTTHRNDITLPDSGDWMEGLFPSENPINLEVYSTEALFHTWNKFN